jgi:tryptophan synthase alpha chain
MNRLDASFAALKAEGRKALVPYITSGHPTRESTVALMHALVDGGADVIELGVPFSDPMADGPTIQRSNEQALALGVGLSTVLDYVKQFRQTNDTTPIVLMGYANPIEAMGAERFTQRARAAGADGVIVVDYPPEEAAEFARLAGAVDLCPIFLLAPTSTDARIEQVVKLARGYLYYVSLRGITGGTFDAQEVAQKVAYLRSKTALPIGVGFGIRDGATAQAVGRHADAVIIGTRMIQILEEGPVDEAPARAKAFMAQIRAALQEIGA